MTKKFKNPWVQTFLLFLGQIKITSKESVTPGPILPYDAQMRFLRELDDGLNDGVHEFICLKARQLGISTIMLALDIFWLYMYPGLQGALIADTADNKDAFRATITEMLESLPKGFKIPIKSHNRAALTLKNGSRLQYMSAGKGKNSGLGRSRALNFVHATECSSWGDQKGLDSLLAALAQENPNRLYIFESTALGYNLFYDMYRTGLEDGTKRSFFIGWWAKEIYRIPAGTPEYERWWGQNPQLDDAEQHIATVVKADYDHDITSEQWAWYRKLAYARGEGSLMEEFPYHARVAFQVTGSSFFSSKRVNEDLEFISTKGVIFKGYRYEMGNSWLRMKCEQVYAAKEADLKVWEEPQKNGWYVMGIDVAYGRSETNDRHCLQVFRCFADKIVQVAEYATSRPETQQVAWVMAHLAGSYRNCMINLEISGPGFAVMNELKYLRQQINIGQLRDLAVKLDVHNALEYARWFLYHRPDTPGQNYVYNWRTNWDNKLNMFNRFRDSYNTEQVICRSVPLLEEMTTLVQNGNSIHASARNKDDRPFAAGLATYAWAEWVRPTMMAENRTFDREMAKQLEIESRDGNVIEGIIPNFFAAKKKEREDTNLKRMLEGW